MLAIRAGLPVGKGNTRAGLPVGKGNTRAGLPVGKGNTRAGLPVGKGNKDIPPFRVDWRAALWLTALYDELCQNDCEYLGAAMHRTTRHRTGSPPTLLGVDQPDGGNYAARPVE